MGTANIPPAILNQGDNNQNGGRQKKKKKKTKSGSDVLNVKSVLEETKLKDAREAAIYVQNHVKIHKDLPCNVKVKHVAPDLISDASVFEQKGEIFVLAWELDSTSVPDANGRLPQKDFYVAIVYDWTRARNKTNVTMLFPKHGETWTPTTKYLMDLMQKGNLFSLRYLKSQYGHLRWD